MHVALPWWRGRLPLAAAASLLALAGPGAAHAMAAPGALYTQTNDPAGNAVLRFDRAPDGTLEAAGTSRPAAPASPASAAARAPST